MFAGHFGLAAAVKAKEPETPLWALMLSTQLLDVIFAPLYAAGIETIQPLDGGGYGEQVIHANYSHSLAGALVIALAAGLLAGWKWSRRSGLVIGAVVFSHWLLDLLVHRGDLPILPGNLGNLPTLGFGLWASPALSIALEGLLVAAGAILYFRSVQSRAAAARGVQRASDVRAVTAGTAMGVLLVASLVTSVIGL